MPRSSPRKSDTVVETTLHAVQEDIVVPMFPDLAGDPSEPSKIDIDRITPNDGYLHTSTELKEVTPPWLRDTFGGGLYELKLYAKNGSMLGSRRLKIAGNPIPKQELETQAQAVKDQQAQAESSATLQARLFREQIELLKQDQEASRQRARLELELSMQRLTREAEEREERERRRHDRDMERERERSRQEQERERERNSQERAREREALQAQQAMNQAFMASIQASTKEQTALVMALFQNNSKTDPLEAAVRINSMVESRLELQQGDPEERQNQQMWTMVGKGMDMIGQAQQSTPAAVAAGAASGLVQAAATQRRPAPARPAPASSPVPNPAAADPELPIPKVVQQRLASILKKIQAAGMDPLMILEDLDKGELAIVPADEYHEGQAALAELGHPVGDDDDDNEPDAADDLANRERPRRPRANAAAMAQGEGVHGRPPSTGAHREPDAQPGTSPEGPAPAGPSGAAVQPNAD